MEPEIQPPVKKRSLMLPIIIASLFLLGISGYFIWQSSSQKTDEPTNQEITVSSDPEVWKEVNQEELTNVTDTSCGYTIATTSKCVEQMFYIPKDDTFATESQFGVKVNVFEKTDSASVEDWYVAEIQGGALSELTQVTSLTINGLNAVQFETNIEDDVYKTTVLHYAIDTGDGRVVVLQSRLQQPITEESEETDYSSYKDDVIKLAESLTVS